VSFDYRLKKMVGIFEQCLRTAEVFSRDVPNKSPFEWNEREERDGSHWAVLAAGISDEAAERYFKKDSQRAEQATIPVKISGGGQATILLQIRPSEWSNSRPEPGGFFSHYAPAEGIPCVEILKGQIHLDLPENDLGLFNLRWEVDPTQSGKPPLEDWLKEWRQTLGYNPAHPTSHLHFNSQPKGPTGDRSWGSEEPAENDLRLAIGDPNPLAFLLSVASWVRRTLKVR
jgi:hypothetical protein